MRIVLLRRVSAGIVILALVFTVSCAPANRIDVHLQLLGQIEDPRLLECQKPLIIIPGIMGSNLQAGDQKVWGNLLSIWPLLGGDRFKKLALDTMTDLNQNPNPNNAYPNVTVRPDGILQELELGPLFFLGPLIKDEIEQYGNLLDRLKNIRPGKDKPATYVLSKVRPDTDDKVGLEDEGRRDNLFEFDYDWRRDNISNAKRLGDYIRRLKRDLKKQARWLACNPRVDHKLPEVRFDIIAHSMGGLIAQYYVAYGNDPRGRPTFEGRQSVERLILVGTPSRGAQAALRYMILGYDEYPFILDPDLGRAVISTMPSAYQLLPFADQEACHSVKEGSKCPDIYDLETWTNNHWGLFDEKVKTILKKDWDESKTKEYVRSALERSLEFHNAITLAQKNWRSLSDDVPHPELILVGAYCQETYRRGLWEEKNGNIGTMTYPTFKEASDKSLSAHLFQGGDGKVFFDSLAPQDFRYVLANRPIIFHCKTHADLYKDEAFLDDLLALILRLSDVSGGPKLTIERPSVVTVPIFNTPGDSLALQGKVTGKIDKVTWEVLSPDSKVYRGDADGTNNWKIETIPLKLGSNEITVAAWQGGKVEGSAQLVAVRSGVAPETPSLNITSIDELDGRETVRIDGTATAAITSVSWKTNSGEEIAATVEPSTTGKTIFHASPIPIRIGANVITLTGKDKEDHDIPTAKVTVTLATLPEPPPNGKNGNPPTCRPDTEDTLLFKNGEATWLGSQENKETLKRIVEKFKDGTLLEDKSTRLEIRGFTDRQPISGRLNAKYPNNWHLGAARALSVLDKLEKEIPNNIIKQLAAYRRIVLLDYGEFRSVSDQNNDAKSRRVVVSILRGCPDK